MMWWIPPRVRELLLQGCIFRLTCSHPDHVLTSAYVKIFRTVTRNAVNKSVWGKKDCFWLPLNKHAVNIWLSSLRIRAHLSWRTGKHLHVLHVLRTYPTCSYPGYQDTTTYAALPPPPSHSHLSLSLSLLAQVPQKVRSELPETDFRRDPSADFALWRISAHFFQVDLCVSRCLSDW